MHYSYRNESFNMVKQLSKLQVNLLGFFLIKCNSSLFKQLILNFSEISYVPTRKCSLKILKNSDIVH